MNSGLETRCPTCNAAIAFNPEDIIITCEYCGGIATTQGETVPNHIMLANNVEYGELIPLIRDWLPKRQNIKAQEISVSNVRPMLIPYWVVQIEAHSQFMGYQRATEYEEHRRTRTRNGKRETYTERVPVTVYRPVESTIDEDRMKVLLARQGALYYGQSFLEGYIDEKIPYSEPFSVETLKSMGDEVKFLSGEIEEMDAREILASKTRQDHRDQARSRTTELFDCRTQLVTKESRFMHYPFWIIEYAYGKKTYRIAMDGNSKKILKGEVPVTMFKRVFNYILTMLFLIIGAGITQYINLNYESGPDVQFPIVTLISGVIFALITIFFYHKVFHIDTIKSSKKG